MKIQDIVKRERLIEKSNVLEDELRQKFDQSIEVEFMNEINYFSVDFIREASKYIDIKRMLWNARPWDVEETIEEHMEMWHPHLKEFWKDILIDDRYKKFYKPPKKIKTIKQILLSVK